MCNSKRLETKKEQFLQSLLIEKVSGGDITSCDKKIVDKIFSFAECVFNMAIGKRPRKENQFRKCFDSILTRDYLGSDFRELKIVIEVEGQNFFVIENKKKILKVIRRSFLEIDFRVLILIKNIFFVARKYLEEDFLMDSTESGILDLLSINVFINNVHLYIITI